jgi:hypothetical protein
VPQFIASVCVFTQFVPHIIIGDAHAGTHDPVEHISVPLHAWLHVPQFALSLRVSTHAGPQRIWPDGHVAGTHAPPMHASVVAVHA